MNAAVRSFVRNCLFRGDIVLGIHEGVEGLIEGHVKELKWQDVAGWVGQGGAFLGTKRTLPDGNIDKVRGANRSKHRRSVGRPKAPHA